MKGIPSKGRLVRMALQVLLPGFILTSCLESPSQKRVGKLQESEEGRIVSLEILRWTSTSEVSRYKATFTLTYVSPGLLDAAVEYKSKKEGWSEQEKDSVRQRVRERFAETTPFILCYKQGESTRLKLNDLARNMVLVDERGRACCPITGRYTRGLEAEHVENATGYVYFPRIALADVNSYNVTLKGVTHDHDSEFWCGDLPNIVFQFDTSEVDLAALVRKGLTDEQILETGSIDVSLSASDALNILSIVLSLVSLAG